MITGYRSTLCQPEQKFFRLIAENNRNIFDNLAIKPDYDARYSIRRQVIEAAVSFMNSAQKRLPGKKEVFNTEVDERQLIAMTGHQPLLYHPGLLFKNLILSEYVGSSEALGINVIVDIDTGSCGEFYYPKGERLEPRLEKGDIYRKEGVYELQSFSDHQSILEELAKCEQELSGLGFDREAIRVRKAAALYEQIEPGSSMVANMLVRRAFERSPDYLEVPFSTLLQIPEVQQFVASFILDFENFHLTYNRTLAEHRREHKIKNSANPFPNLLKSDGFLELPLWFINERKDERKPCYVKKEKGEILFASGRDILGKMHSENGVAFPEDLKLVPGGMIVTLLLRVFFSDLFIHGKGGARYDAFTDRFMRNYLSITPPAFITASGSRYLFQDEIEKHELYLEREKQKREMVFRPGDFLDSDLWSEDDRTSLSKLIESKNSLIGELKRRKSAKESAQDVGAKIKKVDEALKTMVTTKLESLSPGLKGIPDRLEKVIYFREFPYFFFDDVAL